MAKRLPRPEPQPEPRPELLGHAPTGRADGYILLLHGGRPRSHARDSVLRNTAIWRLVPFDRELRLALRAHPDVCIGVQTVRYRYRGWNAPRRDPVRDTLWAIDEIRDHHGADIPIALLGHSMGGRVAVHVAAMRAENVISIVALAPWWPELDALALLGTHTRLRVLHGNVDPITNPRTSRLQTARLAEQGLDARWYAVAAGGHYMVRSPSLWHHCATQFLVDDILAAATARRTTGHGPEPPGPS